jgi:hypothetical protein
MPPFKALKEKLCPCGCGNLCAPYYTTEGRFKGYSHRASNCPTSAANKRGPNPRKGRKKEANKRWLPDGSTRLHRADDTHTYRLIKIQGKWIFEHRYIMEQHLGRPLTTNEHVHHKRPDETLNNALDNLELLTNADHARHHGQTRLSGWDAHPEGCLLCGTTEKPYCAKGLCITCKNRTYRTNNPDKIQHYRQTNFLRHKEAIYARNRDYHYRVRKPKLAQQRMQNPS